MLVAALFLVGCKDDKAAAEKQEQSKVGVLNLGLMFQSSKASEAARQYMVGVEKDLQAEIEKIASVMPKDSEGNVDKESMPALQKAYADAQQRLNAEQQMVLTKLNTLATETVDEYRVKHGLDLVVRADQIFSFDPTIDITKDIIAIMDSKEVSFTPMLPEGQAGTAQGNATAPAGNATAPAGNATAPAN